MSRAVHAMALMASFGQSCSSSPMFLRASKDPARAFSLGGDQDDRSEGPKSKASGKSLMGSRPLVPLLKGVRERMTCDL